jgi:Peptidase family S41/Tricorn protease C1 domain
MIKELSKHILPIFIFIRLFASCIEEPKLAPNTAAGNFEALWNIIDTRYCYLDYKHINWDSIHIVYKKELLKDTTDEGIFDCMDRMLDELKDGHVNLYSDFNRSRYWKWYTDYPSNFSSSIINSDNYLGQNYRIAGGLRYGKIANGTIGYVYYGDFTASFSDANMSSIFKYFSSCKGLILDVRNNGGGSLDYSEQLASYFFESETLTGYIRHKTGNGHNSFSKPLAIKTAANKDINWRKPVIVLTNRLSYSATNDFVNRMKMAPHAKIIGDKTGGGGGMPLSSELPNGWMIRFSAVPMYNTKMENTEWGIDPDESDSMTVADRAKNIDTIIERAISILE